MQTLTLLNRSVLHNLALLALLPTLAPTTLPYNMLTLEHAERKLHFHQLPQNGHVSKGIIANCPTRRSADLPARVMKSGYSFPVWVVMDADFDAPQPQRVTQFGPAGIVAHTRAHNIAL